MGGHAGGLVDDDQVRVLEQHLERNVLGLGLGRRGRRQLELIAPRHGLAGDGGQHLAVKAHPSILDQGLQAGAGDVGQGGRQGLVQPLAGVLGAQLDLQDFRGRIARLVLAGHAHGPAPSRGRRPRPGPNHALSVAAASKVCVENAAFAPNYRTKRTQSPNWGRTKAWPISPWWTTTRTSSPPSPSRWRATATP